jgi:hypothetical protein
MGVAGVAAFVTCAIWGFQSFQECEDGAGEGAAFAGLADATSEANLVPLAVAAVRKKDAEGKATAVAQRTTRMACSTSTVGSGLGADRRLAVHADHVVVIEQMLASLIVGCGKKLGESPIDSWWRPP